MQAFRLHSIQRPFPAQFMEKIPPFSKQQLEYFHDTSFLLTKREILKRLQHLLAVSERELVKIIREEAPSSVPDDCKTAAGKISRGENYRGLPYLVLDYPRLFKQKDIFTFRTMCWWGNFFSCTLHLQGTVLQQLRLALNRGIRSGHFSPDTYICVNSTPWEYHYEPDNYQLLSEMEHREISDLLDRDFVKISRKMELDHYNNLPRFASSCFQEFIKLPEGK